MGKSDVFKTDKGATLPYPKAQARQTFRYSWKENQEIKVNNRSTSENMTSTGTEARGGTQ